MSWLPLGIAAVGAAVAVGSMLSSCRSARKAEAARERASAATSASDEQIANQHTALTKEGLDAARRGGVSPVASALGAVPEVVPNDRVLRRHPVENLGDDLDALPQCIEFGADVGASVVAPEGIHDRLLTLQPLLDLGSQGDNRPVVSARINHDCSPIAAGPGPVSPDAASSVEEPAPRVVAPSPAAPEADGGAA